jgi:hypothetical protein
LNTAQRKIPGNPGAGGSSPYNEDLGFQGAPLWLPPILMGILIIVVERLKNFRLRKKNDGVKGC